MARAIFKIVSIFLIVLNQLLVTGNPAWAEVFYVASNGSDAGPGSQALPWKTIQKAAQTMQAGDSVKVAAGNYDEVVQSTRSGTSESGRIEFIADVPSNSSNKVTVRGFVISHAYISLNGFDITYQIPRNASVNFSTGSANIVVNPNGHYCRITNNTIRDGVRLIKHDFEFHSSNSSVYTPTGNFRENGFAPGMTIYLGSSSKSYYLNHGTLKTIQAVSEDGHTLFLNEALIQESKNPWFGIIYAGTGNSGIGGINILLGTGTSAASNCVVSGNSFKRLFGTNIIAHGLNHLIERNNFEDMQSFDAVRLFGTNQVFRSNIVRNSPNFIHYSADELGKIPHPEGGNFYDHMVAFLYTYGSIEDRNNVVLENNYFENCYNQLGMFEESPKASGLTIRNNVFVGFPLHMSVSVANTTFENNTFYKTAYEATAPAFFGPRFSNSVPMVGLSIQKNVFFDNGIKRSNGIDQEGWYGIVGNASYTANFNFVAGPETLGFTGKQGFAGKEASGINGGDPLFLNPADPDGLDNKPLTADDGLRPLPNSPLCPSAANGQILRGAYTCLSCSNNTPFAHFAIKDHNMWLDIRDPNWLSLAPEDRQKPWRPYTEPDTIGYAPTTIIFDAAGSVGCLNDSDKSPTGISAFTWDFGDGTAPQTGISTAHTFSKPGVYNVTLTVTNSFGKNASYRNTYKVLHSKPFEILSLPFNNSLIDTSEREHTLKWLGTGSYTTGRWSQAANFDGTNSVSVDHRDDLDGLSTVTLSAWVNKRTNGSRGLVFGKTAVFNLSIGDNGQVNSYLNNGINVYSANLSIAQSAAANQWHHYALTYDGQQMKLFFDGQLMSQATKAMSGNLNRLRDRSVEIGTGFDGFIDELRIFSRALSSSEILNLYNNGQDFTLSSAPGVPLNLRLSGN